MANVGRKQIAITQKMKDEAQRLSSLGFNEKQISETIRFLKVILNSKKATNE